MKGSIPVDEKVVSVKVALSVEDYCAIQNRQIKKPRIVISILFVMALLRITAIDFNSIAIFLS
jgi:hypothetical protein